MTSLVAVLNDQAVALAADSAVTTSGTYGQKIYNTVNKLFTLSKFHPVGIMVYSSATVLTVPVETVIKSYRQQCENDSCATLQDYCDRFADFLRNESKLFPEEARIGHARQVINYNLLRLRDRIMATLNSTYPDWGEPTPAQAKQTARKLLREHYHQVHLSSELPGATVQVRKRLKSVTKDLIGDWSDEFKKTFRLSKMDADLISELGLDLILREYPSGTETGFVIAGFGTDEYAPQLRSLQLESSVFDVHKIRVGPDHDVSIRGPAIVPFAQTQMVDTFVQGRDRRLDNLLPIIIDNCFETQKQNMAQNPAFKPHMTVFASLLDNLKKGIQQQFHDELQEYTGRYHINPVITSVGAMPKEELAVMAEALVNLTSIKRRMSPDAETVGGPTDVAVISKGDGFVWIKRKHYFQAELNPGFGYNYFKV